MRVIIVLIIYILDIYGSNLSTLYKFYEKQEYDKGCDYGFKYYYKNKNNEKFLTLYGLSCLETNNIDRVAIPMINLNKSKSSRENGSYFATILLQKNLLRQAILDKKSLDYLTLPKTKFIISKIFNLFVKKEYKLVDGVYRLESGDFSYSVYIKDDYMIIDVFNNDRFIKRYRYR